jgi:hypothetical protein
MCSVALIIGRSLGWGRKHAKSASGPDSVIRRYRFKCTVCPKADTAESEQNLVLYRSLATRRGMRPGLLEQVRQRGNVVNDPARDQRRAGSLFGRAVAATAR